MRRNYLGETLTNLERSGALRFRSPLSSLHIVDSGSPELAKFLVSQVPDSFVPRAEFHSGRWTLHQTAQRAIAAVAGDPCANWCLVLEDDLDFCDRFLESVVGWLDDHARDDRLMYAFGANYIQIASHFRAGEWDYPVGAFYGAQALAWKREDAAQLAEWLGPDPNYNGIRDHGHDLLLQQWGKSRGLTHFLASAPSFVQHVGVESGINNRFFEFVTWPGRDWYYGRPRSASEGLSQPHDR
jgi:hypothetical protein